MKKWITTSYIENFRSYVFNHFIAKRSNHDLSLSGEFDVLECPNWVVVIARDEHKKLLLVKQYRHGIDDFTLEGPAGVIDPGEDPITSAKRELLEETGHESSDWTYLGKLSANPAFQTNFCHFFFADNCAYKMEQRLDPLEEIEIILVNQSEIKEMIANGEIHHSLFLAALGLYQLHSNSSLEFSS